MLLRRHLVTAYRSGLEETVGAQLQNAGLPVVFEESVIHYTAPASKHRYTPDFELPNGIIIETKGRFVTADRKKHKLIKDQHPDKDIRFVFSNSRARISKTSATTYAAWCEANGFLYADKLIPEYWFTEKRKR